MNQIEIWFLQKNEPAKSCLLFLRDYITGFHPNITVAWKYNMPFYCYRGKMFCYLWVNKKTGQPYIGFVEGKHLHHPDLIAEKRSRMKILPIDPDQDIPVEVIGAILSAAISIYHTDK